jgi:hypothetical protein
VYEKYAPTTRSLGAQCISQGWLFPGSVGGRPPQVELPCEAPLLTEHSPYLRVLEPCNIRVVRLAQVDYLSRGAVRLWCDDDHRDRRRLFWVHRKDGNWWILWY